MKNDSVSSAEINWVTQAESIAHFFGNGKETSATDGSWMTLCPVHGDSASPNLHVSPKEDCILLYCHACGGVRHEEIVAKVKERFQISLSGGKGPKVLSKEERGQWVTPIPSNAPARPGKCWLNPKLGNCTADNMWVYLSENREALLFNARFNITETDGSMSKIYRRLALYTKKDNPQELGWSWHGPDTSLPIYGLEQLSGNWWEKPILLVEGEKAADSAHAHFPDMVVLAFPGGAGNFNRVNWEPLLRVGKVERIILWPDNDAAGKSMAHGPKSLSAFMLQHNIRTKVVPVFDVAELPRKWDLADPLPADWGLEQLRALIDKAQYADVADIARVNRYCGTLAGVDVNLTALRELANTPCATLSQREGNKCQTCMQYRRIEKPQDVVFMQDIQLDWVYLMRHKLFYGLRTHEELDKEGFNACWAAAPGYTLNGTSAAASVLLTDEKTTKVYDFGYRPNSPAVFPVNDGSLRINRWKGFNIAPKFGVEPTPWLNLAKYLITDEGIREHIFDWLAYMVQKPQIKINHGLLLISPTQGVGKDSLIQPLRAILGHNYRDISSRALDSEFSEYLRDTKLLVISELDTIGHRRSTYDSLKPLLAGPPHVLNINIKNMKQIEIDNVVQVIAFSNRDVPIAVDDSDRRWLVYRIEHKKKDLWAPDNFQAYYKWMANEGSAQVFGWLMSRNVARFNASLPAPLTLAKHELAQKSDPKLHTLQDLIETCSPPFDADIIHLPGLITTLRQTVGLNVTLSDLRRYGLLHDAVVTPQRWRMHGALAPAFICRHAEFWQGQSPEVLRKAMLDRTLQMMPRNRDASRADMENEHFEGF